MVSNRLPVEVLPNVTLHEESVERVLMIDRSSESTRSLRGRRLKVRM